MNKGDSLERRTCKTQSECAHDHQLLGTRQAGYLLRGHRDGKVGVSTKLHGVGNGTELWLILVGQAESGAVIRDATTSRHTRA